MKTLKRFYMAIVLSVSILSFLYEIVLLTFSIEQIYDPYRLVGIHGIEEYTKYWSKFRSITLLLFCMGIIILWVIIKRKLEHCKMNRMVRTAVTYVLCAVLLALLSFSINQYRNYTERYEERHEDDYTELLYEDENISDQNGNEVHPAIVTNLLYYEHKTWFQRLYQTEAPFSAFDNNGYMTAHVKLWEDEGADVPEWMYTAWNWILLIQRSPFMIRYKIALLWFVYIIICGITAKKLKIMCRYFQ